MTNAKSAAQKFEVLADPTRRKLFERVARAPGPVVELASGLPVTRSAVSQHLRVLREAGLVTVASQGTRRIYRLDPRGIAAMRDWLDSLWSSALDAFQAYADQQEDAR